MAHCPKPLHLEISQAHQTAHSKLDPPSPHPCKTEICKFNLEVSASSLTWPRPCLTIASSKSMPYLLHIIQRNSLLSIHRITSYPSWSPSPLSPWIKPEFPPQLSVTLEVDETGTTRWCGHKVNTAPLLMTPPPPCHGPSLWKVYKVHPFSILVTKCRVTSGNSQTWLGRSFSGRLPLARQRMQYAIQDKGLIIR